MKWFLVALLSLGVWLLPTTALASEGLHFKWGAACDNIESVVKVIEASHFGSTGPVFQDEVVKGKCKSFDLPRPIGVHFIQVVRTDLMWGDGDPMYIIKGEDKTGFVIYVWMPKSSAKMYGIDGKHEQPV